jgi:hypothetical protein
MVDIIIPILQMKKLSFQSIGDYMKVYLAFGCKTGILSRFWVSRASSQELIIKIKGDTGVSLNVTCHFLDRKTSLDTDRLAQVTVF